MSNSELLRLLVKLLAGTLTGLTLLCIIVAIVALNFGATETGGCFLSASVLLFLASVCLISRLI